MALTNPQLQFASWLKSFVGSDKFRQLSPPSQQILLQAAQSGQMPQGQAFQSAMDEASAKGFVPKMTAKDWLAVAGIIGAGVAAPFAIGALGGAGSEAGLGPVSAGGGVTSATVPASLAAPASGGFVGADVTGTAAASGGVLPATTTAPLAGVLPAGGAGLAGATATGGSGMGVFETLFSKDVLPYVIGGAAQVGGAAIAAHGNTEAAKIQAESFDKALAEQKRVYEEQRKDLEPYRGLGSGAVGNLAYLSGITLPPPAAQTPAATTPAAINVAPKPPTSALPGRGDIAVGRLAPWANNPKLQGAAMNQSSGLVRVRSPQGTVHLIPADQVSAAEASGGVRV